MTYLNEDSDDESEGEEGDTCPQCGSTSLSGYANDPNKFECDECGAKLNINELK
jgi:ribosomal protein S27AE